MGGESPLLQRCRFFAGDWEAILAPVAATWEQHPPPPPKEEEALVPLALPSRLLGSADVILMSDTLYTEELSVKALRAIVRLLKKPSSHTEKGGEAYVAAKRYYFGTGGSVAFFEGLVTKCNSVGPTAFASTKHAEEQQHDSAQDSSPSNETHLKLHLEKLSVGM
jgi:hypothetical protein